MSNDLDIPFFTQTVRACALQMLSNASYIQRELPSLDIPTELRLKVETVCGSLINTKHDVITELFELEEMEREGADEERLSEKMERTAKWLCEPIEEMHEVVLQLQKLISNDIRYSSVFLLFVESATNIINSLPSNLLESKNLLSPEIGG
ncbi:MAG: hypothetical protein U1F71_19375 [Verrucomicrobiaceae bacterium]